MENKEKSRFWILFVSLFLMGVVFLGGTYLFIVSQKAKQPSVPIVNKTLETQKEIDTLDDELSALEMKAIDADFTEIDQELKNL